MPGGGARRGWVGMGWVTFSSPWRRRRTAWLGRRGVVGRCRSQSRRSRRPEQPDLSPRRRRRRKAEASEECRGVAVAHPAGGLAAPARMEAPGLGALPCRRLLGGPGLTGEFLPPPECPVFEPFSAGRSSPIPAFIHKIRPIAEQTGPEGVRRRCRVLERGARPAGVRAAGPRRGARGAGAADGARPGWGADPDGEAGAPAPGSRPCADPRGRRAAGRPGGGRARRPPGRGGRGCGGRRGVRGARPASCREEESFQYGGGAPGPLCGGEVAVRAASPGAPTPGPAPRPGSDPRQVLRGRGRAGAAAPCAGPAGRAEGA